MKMDKTKEKITEILSSLSWLLDAHDGFVELGEIKSNKVVIYCGGECIACDNKCIEEAIKEKMPNIEVVFR